MPGNWRAIVVVDQRLQFRVGALYDNAVWGRTRMMALPNFNTEGHCGLG
jgi:hypothetical protein